MKHFNDQKYIKNMTETMTAKNSYDNIIIFPCCVSNFL